MQLLCFVWVSKIVSGYNKYILVANLLNIAMHLLRPTLVTTNNNFSPSLCRFCFSIIFHEIIPSFRSIVLKYHILVSNILELDIFVCLKWSILLLWKIRWSTRHSSKQTFYGVLWEFHRNSRVFRRLLQICMH